MFDCRSFSRVYSQHYFYLLLFLLKQDKLMSMMSASATSLRKNISQDITPTLVHIVLVGLERLASKFLAMVVVMQHNMHHNINHSRELVLAMRTSSMDCWVEVLLPWYLKKMLTSGQSLLEL